MRIGNLINNSTAEVKNHIADVIWFQGCYFKCPYCFNPELRDMNNGIEMTVAEIIQSLSGLSDVVVLTGGEPLHQPNIEIENLIYELQQYGKKVVIETAVFSQIIYMHADKIYGSIFCYEPLTNIDLLESLDYYKNVELVVVIGYPQFRLDVFRDLIKHTKKDIWIKYYNGKICDTKEIYRILKGYHKPCKVLDKLVL